VLMEASPAFPIHFLKIYIWIHCSLNSSCGRISGCPIGNLPAESSMASNIAVLNLPLRVDDSTNDVQSGSGRRAQTVPK
jgi:hypothetical protein